MDSKRRWLGWIALSIDGIALVVALFGAQFGPQGAGGWNAPQAYAQQGQVQVGNGPQSGVVGSDANAQPGMQQRGNGQQGVTTGPGANAQSGASQKANGSQTNIAGRGADVQHGAGHAGLLIGGIVGIVVLAGLGARWSIHHEAQIRARWVAFFDHPRLIACRIRFAPQLFSRRDFRPKVYLGFS